MKWHRRKAPSQDSPTPDSQDSQTPEIQVADTGDAQATGGATVVTGYKGPSTGGEPPAAGPVSVTQTGSVVAALGSVGVAGHVAGDITVNYRAVPRTPAPWPHKVGVIPREADVFLERGEEERLRAAVTGGGTAVLCQVLRGTGGVGKTQLAARYARRTWTAGELDVLVWASASSRSAIISTYAQAAEELLATEPGDPERSAQAFLSWLEPRPPGSGPACRWLVVLDDVTDPADMTGLWPVKNPHGRTVVTTRRRDVAVAGHRIDLGAFTPEQATTYLTGFLTEHGRHDTPEEIRALAQDLGHLPLALSQAAAYIVDAAIPIDCPGCTHEDCLSYRRRLADRTTKLFSVLPEEGSLPDDQTTTVAAAWSLCIERANGLRPTGLAHPTLQLGAMLDPNGIPQDVFTSQAARNYVTRHRAQAGAPVQVNGSDATEQDVREALRVLHRLNLIDHSPDIPGQAVRIHQLIQRATRDSLARQVHDETAWAAADALVEVWPETAHAMPLGQILRANAQALTTHAEEALYSSDAAHAVLSVMGNSLGHAGQVTAAITHLRHICDALGPDHPANLIDQLNVAHWMGRAGDEAGAVAAYKELLPYMVRFLGADHPETLAARSNLASLRGLAGDSPGAVAAYKDLVPHMARVLGPDHPKTLAARANHAMHRGRSGDAVGAAAAATELLADRTRVQGKDHRGTLATRRELAYWLGEAGDPAAATKICEQLLADYARVLGADHPDSLKNRQNLAHLRGEAGDVAGAIASYEDVLLDQTRVLGPDHPDTLSSRNSLAAMKGEVGDAAGAVADYESLLPDNVRVLGPDHPGTLVVRVGLAYWRGGAGDAAGAVAAYEELLPDMARVFGPDHVNTLIARGNLAHWRGQAGDTAGATAGFARLVRDMKRVLGSQHPLTRRARNNCAYWRWRD